MRTRTRRRPALLVLLLTLLALVALSLPGVAGAEDRGRALLGPPTDVHTTVVPGRNAIEVTWSPPRSGVPVGLAYDVLVNGKVVRTTLLQTSHTITEGLQLGNRYEIGVRSTLGITRSDTVSKTQQLHIAPVTTRQSANPDNPLAGREWGVYTGLQDPAVNGWSKLKGAERKRLAPIAMIHKAKFFGRWIPDAQAYQKTRDYIAASQAGDPERLTLMTLFRMFPWEGQERITNRLPTAAEQAAYKRFVTGMARAIGDQRVAVVVQPDGFFAWKAYRTWLPKVGRKKSLLPARMLAWTAKTLAAGAHTSVYVDMGSEDWARGKVEPVAKFLKLSGVRHARGFALNVSHKNYLEREIAFAKQVSDRLAAMGLPGKHAILETSDNGQPFHGSEINPQGAQTPDYTEPGWIGPCRKKGQSKPCTALGIPPTTDVDHPRWGIRPELARVAAEYVDAYLWVSRPWLPNQGQGGTTFSPRFASLLLKTWEFDPYFSGTP